MQTAVTTALDREAFTRSYTVGRPGKLVGLSEVSRRAESPFFGCRRSPQQAEFLEAGGGSNGYAD